MLIIYLYERQKHVEFHISGLFKRHSLIGFINFSLMIIIRQFRSHYYKGYRTTNVNRTTKITLTIKIPP
jgi:hypothetical protein